MGLGLHQETFFVKDLGKKQIDSLGSTADTFERLYLWTSYMAIS